LYFVFVQNSTESRFGFEDFPEEGRNPRYLNHIAPRIYKLATKVGDGTMTLADPPEAMYAVAKNVGGERADNFYARDEERRESTLTLPYLTHTSLYDKLASNILHAPLQNEEPLRASRMSLTVNIYVPQFASYCACRRCFMCLYVNLANDRFG
jgi:hypothetical protein